MYPWTTRAHIQHIPEVEVASGAPPNQIPQTLQFLGPDRALFLKPQRTRVIPVQRSQLPSLWTKLASASNQADIWVGSPPKPILVFHENGRTVTCAGWGSNTPTKKGPATSLELRRTARPRRSQRGVGMIER